MKNDSNYDTMRVLFLLKTKFFVKLDETNIISEDNLKMAEAPRTPLRNLQPGGDDSLRKTPGGLSMDIVLTPALRPPPPTK